MSDADTKKPRMPTMWNVRDSLPSLEARKRYDEYLKEHRRQLTQLYREARGDMCPSGEWHPEGR